MPLDSTNWSQTETETKPDVFSLEGLIAWLETQPPETEYNFMDCNGGCLIGQYLLANGQENFRKWHDVPPPLCAVAGQSACKDDGSPAGEEGLTFGAALSRARALLASQSTDAYLAETRK